MLVPFSYCFLVSRALVVIITTYFIFQKNSFYPKNSYMYVCFCILYNAQQILSQTPITDKYLRGFSFSHNLPPARLDNGVIIQRMYSGILTTPLSKQQVNKAKRKSILFFFLIFCRYTTWSLWIAINLVQVHFSYVIRALK